SSLDWHGRWKALHYLAKRFFAPVLISGVENLEAGTVDIHISSDAGEEKAGTVKWFATDAAGKVLQEGSQDVTIAPRTSACVQTLELQPLLDEHSARNVIVWLELHVNGETISDNVVTFQRPKHLALQVPQIQAVLKTEGDKQFIEFTTDVVAFGVWVEALGEAEFHLSDSFFCQHPGQTISVQVISDAPISESDFAVHSLADTHA
ncbi:MAG: hypothetical protein KC496_18010, partial [Anaerolineae bacterium]|nr:hypothetical protein [Anaerolineae bacterium]